MTRTVCNVFFQSEVDSCHKVNILGAYQTCRLEMSQSQPRKNWPSDKSTHPSWFGGFCERSFSSLFYLRIKTLSCMAAHSLISPVFE